MINQPLVSILMTAYNREKFIAEAIESVLASTYTNFELIIVDDRSSDTTVEIAKSYEKKDSRVHVYVNEQNLGDYPNRNKAASYAKGKYIKYIDADDAIYYWGLEVVVEMMERFPDAALGFDSILQDDHKMFPILLSPLDAYKAHYSGRLGIFSKAPTSCIINREVFVLENGFMPLRMIGDFEMWHRLSLKYSSVVMPDGIVWSRGHDDSESSKMFPDPAINYQYLMVSRQYLTDNACPLDNLDKRQYTSAVTLAQVKMRLNLLRKLDIKSFRAIGNLDSVGLLDLIKLYLRN